MDRDEQMTCGFSDAHVWLWGLRYLFPWSRRVQEFGDNVLQQGPYQVIGAASLAVDSSLPTHAFISDELELNTILWKRRTCCHVGWVLNGKTDKKRSSISWGFLCTEGFLSLLYCSSSLMFLIPWNLFSQCNLTGFIGPFFSIKNAFIVWEECQNLCQNSNHQSNLSLENINNWHKITVVKYIASKIGTRRSQD